MSSKPRRSPTTSRWTRTVNWLCRLAPTVEDLEAMLDSAGFEAIEIAPTDESTEFISDWDADRDLGDYSSLPLSRLGNQRTTPD